MARPTPKSAPALSAAKPAAPTLVPTTPIAPTPVPRSVVDVPLGELVGRAADAVLAWSPGPEIRRAAQAVSAPWTQLRALGAQAARAATGVKASGVGAVNAVTTRVKATGLNAVTATGLLTVVAVALVADVALSMLSRTVRVSVMAIIVVTWLVSASRTAGTV